MLQSRLVMRIAAALALASVPLLAASRPARAGVNLKNGNFYTTWTDLEVETGGQGLRIARTYNSRSAYIRGHFGLGWGTWLDTRLTVDGDTVTVQYLGSGARASFRPAQSPPGALEAFVDVLVRGAREQLEVTSDGDEARLRAFLLGDVEQRRGALVRLRRAGLVASDDAIPVGTRLVPARSGGAGHLTRVPSGFVLDRTGERYHFDEAGRLVLHSAQPGRFVRLVYGTDGKLRRLEDDTGAGLTIAVTGSGLIERIAASDGRFAAYRHDERGRLTESRDERGRRHTYAYDDRDNLIRIGYEDGTAVEVAYDAKTDFVSRVTERLGIARGYAYGTNPADPDREYWTDVSRLDADGRELRRNRYHYWIGVNARGVQFTRKILTEVDGKRTETEYSEAGYALRVSALDTGEVDVLEPDVADGGLVARIRYRGETFERTDHARLKDRAVRFARFPTDRPDAGRTVEYDLDEHGNPAGVRPRGDGEIRIDFEGARITEGRLAGGTVVAFRREKGDARVEIEVRSSGARARLVFARAGTKGTWTAKEAEGDADAALAALGSLRIALAPVYVLSLPDGDVTAPHYMCSCSGHQGGLIGEPWTAEEGDLHFRSEVHRQLGRYDPAIAAAEALAAKRPDHGSPLFLTLCAHAARAASRPDTDEGRAGRAADIEAAFATLGRHLERQQSGELTGGHLGDELLDLPELAAVRADPRFRKLFPRAYR